MKKIYLSVFSMLLFLAGTVFTSVNVSADTSISELTVQAKNAEGELTDLTFSPELSADVTEYQLGNLLQGTEKLEFTVTPTEEGAVYTVEWDVLEVGDNKTFVKVTDAAGVSTTYTFYSHVMTSEEEETYVPIDGGNASGYSEDVLVEVDGYEMQVVSNFSEEEVPAGFSVVDYELNNETVKAIKGDVKKMVAVWLVPTGEKALTEDGEETTTAEESEPPKEGFYVYRPKKGVFYKMSNLYIKSRMFTYIKNLSPADFIKEKKYEKTDITIGDETVTVWVLDETNQLYLLYAMNWDGESNLYCYDAVEESLQRYVVNSSADRLLESANAKTTKLQKEKNEIADKYNKSNRTKWIIIGALLIIIVILIFVILNMRLADSEKELDDDESFVREKFNPDDYVQKSASEDKEEFEDDYEDDDFEFEEYDEEGKAKEPETNDNMPDNAEKPDVKADLKAEKKAAKEAAKEAKRAKKADKEKGLAGGQEELEELFLLVDEPNEKAEKISAKVEAELGKTPEIKEAVTKKQEPIVSNVSNEDFVIVNGSDAEDSDSLGTIDETDFNIAEIDLSDEVKKEMASKGEKFDKTDVFNALNEAFPNEEEKSEEPDEDGFTFI